MLVLLTILFAVSAVVTFAVFFKTRQNSSVNNYNEIEPSFRPLFAPSEDEIRDFEREEKLRLAANLREMERQKNKEKIAKIRDFQKDWQNLPDKSKTVKLLRLAAESGNGKIFAEICEEILRFRREKGLKSLSKNDLADLLESHFRTLPQQERTSGALFRLREEIAELRRESEVQTDDLSDS